MKRSYSLKDFDQIPSAKEIVGDSVKVTELPSLEEVKTLASWTSEMLEKFNKDQNWFIGHDKHDRSAALSELAYFGAERGWTDEQIATVLYDADDRWGKYKGRRNRDRLLLDLINRARQKHGYNAPENIDLSKLIASANQTAQLVGEEQKLVYGFQDFVESEFRVEWVLDQLLAQGGFGLVVAHPGVGKTQFCIAMGLHLALGMEYFLRWENKAGQKKVLFLSLEMGAAPLNLFMGTIGGGYDNKTGMNRNFLVAPLGTPIPLDTKEGQAFLDNLMDEYMPDVVIIDSLQKVMSKELTDEQGVKNLIHYLSRLRSKYGCSLVVVHHNRKKPNEGAKKHISELSDVYGSTYLATDVDFVLSLQPEETGLLTVRELKNRLGKMLEPFEIVRDDKTLGFSLDLSGLAEKFSRGDDDNVPDI